VEADPAARPRPFGLGADARSVPCAAIAQVFPGRDGDTARVLVAGAAPNVAVGGPGLARQRPPELAGLHPRRPCVDLDERIDLRQVALRILAGLVKRDSG
jgi:hypothetical protein